MKVDPDWWKKLFDDIYLVTDARSVCDDDITGREVDLIRADARNTGPASGSLDTHRSAER